MLQRGLDIVEFCVARERPVSEAREGRGRQPHSSRSSIFQRGRRECHSGVEP